MAQEKFFPTQASEEKIFLLLRKHWFNYIIFVFLAVMMIIPVIAIVVYLTINIGQIEAATASFLIVVASTLFLATLALELYGFVDYYLDVYIVTDQRLVDISQNGLYRREISELQIRQVQDVSAHVDGFFNTLLHFGDVYIQTAGDRENFIFTSIPHPYTVSKQIVDLHEKAVQQLAGIEEEPLRTYDEDSLEKGLEVEDVEKKAKELITDPRKVVHQARGVYVPKTNKTAIDSFKKEASGALDKSGNHELKEGEETKIEDEK